LYYEKYLLYQQITNAKDEGTIMRGMIHVLDSDYWVEYKRRLMDKVTSNEFTVIGLINVLVTTQNQYHSIKAHDRERDRKRKHEFNTNGFKRQNYTGRNTDRNARNGKSAGFQYTNPICQICKKRHLGECRYKNTQSNNNNASSTKICDLCHKPGHIKKDFHKGPANAAAEWRAKKQQENNRNNNGNVKTNPFKPKTNANQVNNINADNVNVKKDDVTMTDMVQDVVHSEPDEDLLDFDSV